MNNVMNAHRQHQTGFTIVELMISVALGLILISGLITAFVGSQRTSKLNTTLTEIQQTGRFALDSMVRDIRMAGFQGCANISSMPARVRADSAPTDNYITSALQVFKVGAGGTWIPEPHDSFIKRTGVGAPIPGTHAISIQFGSPTTYRIDPMTTTLAPIVVSSNSSNSVDLVTGDLAIISDCSGADIFEITGSSGNVLQHGPTGNSGDARLSAPYGQGNALNRPRIMRFHANIYYVGDTGRVDGENKTVRALYRQTLPYSNEPIEMAEGVENLRVRAGVEDPVNPGSFTLVTPENSLLETQLVRSVQLGFLMQSYDSVADDLDTRTYQIAGYDIPAGNGTITDGSAHSKDRKMRLPFNGTVSIRNQ